MTLVIMAAGVGSRFGGLKQLEPVDENGNFIIDYIAYDAYQIGFKKLLFIIKKESLSLWKPVFKRLSAIVKVDYVFQKNELPWNFITPTSRKKPFGTGHALLSAKDKIDDHFALVNADDFYGKEALASAYQFLCQNKSERVGALIAYKAQNSLSAFGKVKRGICEIENNFLKNLSESEIELSSDKIMSIHPIGTNYSYIKSVKDNVLVSMNLFVLPPKIFNYLDNEFLRFLNENENNLEFAEFFLPKAITSLILQNKLQIMVEPTNSIWKGLTYREDLEDVKNYIKSLKLQNKYPKNLWN